MAATAPSSLFVRLSNTWRYLSLRSDVDDIILELLGHFSLEKVYAGPADRETYQALVTTLLAQLNAIFYIQRLTLPAENVHVGWYLGFLVSWEVALRTVEFVLQTVAEGRESLWEDRRLRDRYLAEFLLSALRVLTLHPKAPANQRAKDRRDRFAGLHRSLEQVFDSYPGPKSFLLEVCREVTNQLHLDPDVLGLPERLRYELPNLTSELYPLPDCLLPPYVSELVPVDELASCWLPQFLALRDVSQFVIGASIQYAVNRETRDVRLQSSSARARNSILNALDNLRLPSHLPKQRMMTVFSSSFRVILPDTLDLSRRDLSDSHVDEYQLDALDLLCARLKERQIIHRMSDREMMHSVSQVVRSISLQDDPAGQFATALPSLYIMNCSECHLVGGSQLKNANIRIPSEHPGAPEIRLSPRSKCLQCGELITMVREVPLVRKTWELLRPLEPDADTINVERHLPTQFQQGPQKTEAGHLFSSSSYGNLPTPGSSHQRPLNTGNQPSFTDGVTTLADSSSVDPNQLVSPILPSPMTSDPRQTSRTLAAGSSSRGDTGSSYNGRRQDYGLEMTYSNLDQSIMTEPTPISHEPLTFHNPGRPGEKGKSPLYAPAESTTAAAQTHKTVPLINPPDKSKSKWKLKFPGGPKKTPPAAVASGDTNSSLSSTAAMEVQKLDEISLSGLLSHGTHGKASARGKAAKSISVSLSHSSPLALFWAQQSIQIWNVGTSPPTMMRAVSTDSTCILAAVAMTHLAYIIGTRDQKLTLRIVNLVQPSIPVVEYRIPSYLWCKSMAIDREENYVVVGFESCTVRFFKTANTGEPPREDRLHSAYHMECIPKTCPSVDTLSFSSDGLVLVAGTRSPKSGLIQVYCWRFPYLTFQELTSCRYPVPLHESEDNGISSVIYRSTGTGAGIGENNDLVCITTWTQSGVPLLVQPHPEGHRSEVRNTGTKNKSSTSSKLGSRIQCAIFSPSGRELAMVNDEGNLFQISNLDSVPMDIKKLTTTKELTAKSDAFSMAYMTLPTEDESIVLVWADSSKATGCIKRIPVASRTSSAPAPPTPGQIIHEAATYPEPNAEIFGEKNIIPPRPPVELAATERADDSPTIGSPPTKSKRITRNPFSFFED